MLYKNVLVVHVYKRFLLLHFFRTKFKFRNVTEFCVMDHIRIRQDINQILSFFNIALIPVAEFSGSISNTPNFVCNFDGVPKLIKENDLL